MHANTATMTQPILRAFADVMHRAAEKGTDLAELVRSARRTLRRTRETGAPASITASLATLGTMARMIESPDSDITEAARARIVGALAYVAEPHDFIPDETPELGLLDDAIVVRSVANELRTEIESFEGRERRAMYARMQRRRDQRARRGGHFAMR
jgi:uncharacterized membrane protein YkvA (DUF1232 family)